MARHSRSGCVAGNRGLKGFCFVFQGGPLAFLSPLQSDASLEGQSLSLFKNSLGGAGVASLKSHVGADVLQSGGLGAP